MSLNEQSGCKRTIENFALDAMLTVFAIALLSKVLKGLNGLSCLGNGSYGTCWWSGQK